MKTYCIYIVQGYNFYDKDKDLFMYFADMEIIAKTEKEALAKAKKTIDKKEYRVKGCYEKPMEKQYIE